MDIKILKTICYKVRKQSGMKDFVANYCYVCYFPAPSPPSGLSANAIPSTTSLSISWMSVPGAVGYIVYYNGGQAELIEGEDSTDHLLDGLNKGNTYQIKVYSYSGFFSASIDLEFPFKGWFS